MTEMPNECAWVLHLIGWFIALSLGTIFGYVLCALLTHDDDDDDVMM